ncbi:nucleoside-diphosphate-sugar epimerase/glycosyltransferase involved in cell wall biosynthesis [Dyadobacter sp. BE34]|uniref:Nucleoside-diphosphate-sugar epimerase/glycosyltransferase involved in cell wall biosynthesis n=1 Tax=Dyadobacter fermentans TaxID=94254 RepID=A0ABU1QSG8_9BACT|nr:MULTISPECIES: NAD-dependent epimerase/dehydratase family protein [Dyadobacter]MDR6804109.1 nucleoside-diphosphate-sugar epimerase/glycosyltransferase involved in cell wall biosynthesis [Dyadobacter fermentans]MDR7041849.1 nucleoside-diphosphate-sugar epimerase/glycosyltransferase involved in cell wall biosynthesis [Dyadobacter sp. BE242]MDR7196252.1 nucleoside-diphosphate-sugar epimerase/glycosyltransferase involved in cell wall biosynthesis [Dyadobacter sp. BE34]MDR7213203.1 nucleoside-diph
MLDHLPVYRDKIEKLKGPVFVFGASGFIGANLFNDIFKIRKDCYAVTHDATKAWRLKLLNVPFENIIHCDILSDNSIKEVFEKYKPQTIFNLAAYGAYSKQSNVNLTYETNVLGTVNILQNCTKDMVYIHAGSSSEYGFNCTSPKETDRVEPNSHYAVSKVSAAYLLEYYAKVAGLKTLNLRLYSIYGYWEEPDRLIPRLIENARKKSLPSLVSPDISRDFVFVEDCVEAFLDAALKIDDEKSGRSYNIATGRKTTMGDLVDVTRKAFSIAKEPEWGSMSNRKWDLAEWFGDPSAFENDFGWKARTSLEDGLIRYSQWQDAVQYESRLIPAFENPKLNPVITAIIACYKDAQAIPFMYERLVKTFNELKVRYEIIFVNDNSPDNQEEVINAICDKDPNVVGISHSRNFGSQSAFLSGMEIATGDCVVLMDGDLQDPPEIIPAFYEKWMDGYDVVYGVRVQREMKPHIHFFYKTFYKVFQGLSYIPIPRDAGDFSMIDRKVVKELVDLPETEQFLRGLRAWVGFKQTGVPYVRPERMFGVSTNNWTKNIWWAKKAIFSFSFAPLELMSYAGFGLTALSILGIIWQILAKFFFFPDTPRGLSTVIILIVFFGGLTILGISFLGEYITKIFEETKKRPKYIRTRIRRGPKAYKTADEIRALVKQLRK